MIIRNNIGERIGFFRRLHNYTQKELGKLLALAIKPVMYVLLNTNRVTGCLKKRC